MFTKIFVATMLYGQVYSAIPWIAKISLSDLKAQRTLPASARWYHHYCDFCHPDNPLCQTGHYSLDQSFGTQGAQEEVRNHYRLRVCQFFYQSEEETKSYIKAVSEKVNECKEIERLNLVAKDRVVSLEKALQMSCPQILSLGSLCKMLKEMKVKTTHRGALVALESLYVGMAAQPQIISSFDRYNFAYLTRMVAHAEHSVNIDESGKIIYSEM